MITREMLRNSHDTKSSIHLVSDKKTKMGDTVSVCTDLLKQGYEVSRDVINILDIENRAIAGADLIIALDYIEDKVCIKLSTSIRGVNDILIEVDEESLIDSLIECVDNNTILSKTKYIGSLNDSLLKQLETSLLEEKGQLMNSSEPLVAYIEVYNRQNILVGKANRFDFKANINSLVINLCEYLGHNPFDDIDEELYRAEFYIGTKKIIAKDINFDVVAEHKSKIKYLSGKGSRSDLSIMDGNLSLYEKSLSTIKQLNVGNDLEDLESLKDYLENKNLPREIMSYVRKNKIKIGTNGIDINNYLLEELL